jgi:hypothetical protein
VSDGSRTKNGKIIGISAEDAGAWNIPDGLAAQVSAACTRFLESRGIYASREFFLYGKQVGMFRKKPK